MSLPLMTLLGLGSGLVLSVPPGPAGVVILDRALRGERAHAARAVAAYFAAELSALLTTLVFLEKLTWLALLPWTKVAAGAYLMAFAALALSGAGAARGVAGTGTAGVFRITIFNPVIWIGAVSVLTVARAAAGAALLPRVLFVSAFEFGGVAWYVAMVFWGRFIPAASQRHLVRAALLVIGATGLWLAATGLRAVAAQAGSG